MSHGDAGPLDGHVALVTGGGRGLGPLLAQGLAAQGAAVAVAARSAAEVTATARRIVAAGGRALAVTADVSDRQAVARVVAEVERHLGMVDVLVNNAGLFRAHGLAWAVDPDVWWRDVEVNLRGPFECARAVLPPMIARRRGRIINVSSGVGGGPLAAASAYAASKAALINFTESLAVEAKAHGIQVFAINPGMPRTAMAEELLAADVLREWQPWYFEAMEAGEDTPPELAVRLVVALASGRADALTGRFLDATADLGELVRRAEEIVGDDLCTLRLRMPPN